MKRVLETPRHQTASSAVGEDDDDQKTTRDTRPGNTLGPNAPSNIAQQASGQSSAPPVMITQLAPSGADVLQSAIPRSATEDTDALPPEPLSEPKLKVMDASGEMQSALVNSSQTVVEASSSEASSDSFDSDDINAEETIKAAEQGDAAAQYELAEMYLLRDDGVERNLKLAACWYHRAATQGHADAQYKLAWMYASGNGVKKNKELAAHWYHQSATQGHPDAQGRLGWMYESGEVVAKNFELALHWYQRATQQGNFEAGVALGHMHERGHGVAKNSIFAAHLYTMIINQIEKDGTHMGGCCGVNSFTRAYQDCFLSLSRLHRDVDSDLYDPKLALYWALRVGQRIGHPTHPILVEENNSAIVDHLPGVLLEFEEFKQVKGMTFICHWNTRQIFSVIEKFIRADAGLESVDIVLQNLNNYRTGKQREDIAANLIAALRDSNSPWVHFNISFDEFAGDNEFWDFANADSMKEEINQLLQRNELRQYLLKKNLTEPFPFPLDVLKQILDKMIVAGIAAGRSTEDIKASLDEMLLIAGYGGQQVLPDTPAQGSKLG